MARCYFCNEKEIQYYFGYYCSSCSDLRRMLLINTPDKCIEILKCVLLRNENQIGNKIKQEIKKIEIKKLDGKSDDQVDYITKPNTRHSKRHD